MLLLLLSLAGAFAVRLLVAALILGITLWASRRLARLAEHGVARLTQHQGPSDGTLSGFVSAVVRYGVVAIGAIAVLQQLGVQATSVLAVLGAASLAIALALQGTLGNVAAGVMILLLRPYRVGDRVNLNGQSGKVVHLDLFNTRVLDYDGLTVHIPNGKVFGDTIINLDQGGRRRVELTVGVSYNDDLDTAIEVMLRVAAADPRVLKEPRPWAKVTDLANSSVNVTLRCWTDPDDWVDAKFDLLKQIKESIEDAGLSFPFPQVVLNQAIPQVGALDTAPTEDSPRS